MSAKTPNAKNHADLAPLASRFVDVAALPWEKTSFAGVEQKILLIERDSGMMTVLLKMAPGAKLPDHEHVLIEQTYLLSGTLVCGEGKVTPGNFVWRPAGSRHEAWAGPEGNLSIAIFQIPNRFYQADGAERDFIGNDWEKSWGDALRRHEEASV
ncbi:MAG: cupin domain-containing protein [Betaproteobacteria bacterium]|nr:cupin domain-containing protein [Betaproteobacteria bacterium]MDH4324501.1 cupin domain-containing protein [Betaproteobacteria bacterium]MDH5577608.1 cupin domain-containing protein [Betaproteobacteria bacterium]